MKLYENIAESLWHSCLNEDLCSAELYIQKLNEKALFGSMASSIKKWQKQIIQLTYEIRWIESGKVNPEVAQAIKAWKEAAAEAEYWSKVSPNAASEAWHFGGHNWHGWCRGNDVGISTVGADGNTHYFLNGQEVDYNTALAKMGGGNRIGDHTGHFSLEFKYPGKDYYFTKLEGTTETGLLGGPGWMDNSSLGKNDIDGFIKTGATWKS